MRKARKGATGEQAGVSKRRKRGFMIYLTGDTHGDFSRVFAFCERMHTTKEDILIVLGDAGLNYYLNDRDKARKKELEAAPITLLCIHGDQAVCGTAAGCSGLESGLCVVPYRTVEI